MYRGARAHILSSSQETFGRSVLESMACGCPSVIQDLPVFREFAGEAAIFTDYSNSEAAATALERICIDDALRALLANQAVDRARRYSFERLARERVEAILATIGARFK
jgi:glycosyltransferase involved in cell wall biosynthesis